MREVWGDNLIRVSRGAFLALIPFAVLNFGLTRASGIAIFNLLAGVTFALWCLGHLLAFRRPDVGAFPVLACVGVLAVGSFTTLAGYPDLAETDISEWPEWLQNVVTSYGTYNLQLSIACLTRTAALLGLFLMAVDMFSDAAWGRRILVTVAGTALALVGFVFLQKFTGNLLVLKSEDGKFLLSFGTYRYWGNAASFLNLTWPIVAAIAVHTGVRRHPGWSLWLAAAVLLFSALYINVSKAGHLLGIAGLVAIGLLIFVYLRKTRRLSHSVFSLKTVLTVLIPAAILGVALFYGIQWKRWEILEERGGILNNERVLAYRHFVRILPDASWFGCGPGTFQHVYPGYVLNDSVVAHLPFWVAHQDYIQTVVEWGYLGTFFWGLLLVPAAFLLLRRTLSQERASAGKTEYHPAFTLGEKIQEFFSNVPAPSAPLVQGGALIAVFLTAIHSLVDFPMQIVSLQFYFLLWIALGWSRR